jgi:hypothetical protein
VERVDFVDDVHHFNRRQRLGTAVHETGAHAQKVLQRSELAIDSRGRRVIPKNGNNCVA